MKGEPLFRGNEQWLTVNFYLQLISQFVDIIHKERGCQTFTKIMVILSSNIFFRKLVFSHEK